MLYLDDVDNFIPSYPIREELGNRLPGRSTSLEPANLASHLLHAIDSITFYVMSLIIHSEDLLQSSRL